MEILKKHVKPNLINELIKYKKSVILKNNIKSQNVLFDFSSPNIAKPFHAGHLRATLLGNFISNLNEFFGHNVYRINYLGDCGTQFGYILYGLKSSKEEIKNLTSRNLFQIYSDSYKTFKSEDELNNIKLMNALIFSSENEIKTLWRNIRAISLNYFKKEYDKLGITFTDYEFESDYHEKIMELINKLETTSNYIIEKDGAKYFNLQDDNLVTLTSKMGASLYISRDLAAAIERIQKYQLDRLHYVVDYGQKSHFDYLKQMLPIVGVDINKKIDDLSPTELHISFGRLSGISTRLGKVVFMEDIFSYINEMVKNRLNNDENLTRTSLENRDSLSNELTKSILISNILSVRRKTNYTFKFNFHDIGFKLQYCRAAIISLEKRCFEKGIVVDNFEDCFNWSSYPMDLLNNSKVVHNLIVHLEKFESCLIGCYRSNDSEQLMGYCKELKSLINLTRKEIFVLNENSEKAQVRLKLFLVSRCILDQCLCILGMPLIDQI